MGTDPMAQTGNSTQSARNAKKVQVIDSFTAFLDLAEPGVAHAANIMYDPMQRLDNVTFVYKGKTKIAYLAYAGVGEIANTLMKVAIAD